MRPSDETLRCEYEEICRSHLAITDFRGKLLGLLPLAAGTGIVLLLRKSNGTQASTLLVGIGLFGTVVTIGLFFYEFRGMKECHFLRARGANLERELKLMQDCSRFRGDTPGIVGPAGAGPIVYFAVVAGWVFVSAYGFGASKPGLEKDVGISIVIAYLIIIVATFGIFHFHILPSWHKVASDGEENRIPQHDP